MKKHLVTAILYTVVTAVLLGIAYPLAITALAQLTMREQANGQLIHHGDVAIGSALIGQTFAGPGYFHSRPSAAGTGYDASASSGSNLGPASKALAQRVDSSVQAEQAATPVPIDLITASGSGLDPDITPAGAMYQVARVAEQRHLERARVEQLVAQFTTPRQLGLLGEPRVNVLRLNLALDREAPRGQTR